MRSIINSYMPDFSLPAYHEKAFKTISLKDLKGKWSILFFYLNDFCFVCPTELSDISDMYEDFRSLGIEIYGISSDSHYAHKAWHDSSPTISKIQFPMVSDKSGALSEMLGVRNKEHTVRGTFLVDPEGKIKIAEFQDKGIGRNAKELFRKVKFAMKV